jgi:hypothetical protein
MIAKKTVLKIPDAYMGLVEDIRLLKSDEQNPNRMTSKQMDEVWKSLQKYGWTYPLITNRDGVFADGEQRATVCRAHSEFYAPVLRLPVSDVDRRMLRQILNKLKGKHNKEADEAEFQRIIEQGEKADLKELLAAVGERLPEDLAGFERDSVQIPDIWELVIECKDEAEQKRLFEKFTAEGFECRVLTL